MSVTKQNPFKLGDRVAVYGFDSQVQFRTGWRGTVDRTEIYTAHVKHGISGQVIIVHWRQCRKLKKK